MTTTTDQPVALLRRSLAALNARDFDALLARMADDYVINLAGAPGPRYGKEVWRVSRPPAGRLAMTAPRSTGWSTESSSRNGSVPTWPA